MKKSFVLIAALTVMASCSVMKPRERVVNVFFLDYRPYAAEGFFLSPDPYPGEFTSLGNVSIEVLPATVPVKKVSLEKKKKRKGEQKFSDGTYNSSVPSSRLELENLSGSDLLGIAVRKARELGADGIANLKFRYVKMNLVQISKTEYEDPSYWEISGLCISRTK